MRLIDGDVLIEMVKRWYWDKEKQNIDPMYADLWINLFITTIKEIPVAFDIDSVLKQLDELDDVALEEYHNTYAGTFEHDFADGKSYAFETAIYIVKAGGIKNEQMS